MIINEQFNTRKPQNAGLLVVVVGVMLVLTFFAGALIGYNRFESHYIDRLNTQFEAYGLGLCNTTSTFVQIDENASFWRMPKLNTSP